MPHKQQLLTAAAMYRICRLMRKGVVAPLESIASLQEKLAAYEAQQHAAGWKVSLRVVQDVEYTIQNLHEQQAALEEGRFYRPA